MATNYPANAGRKMGARVRACYVNLGAELMLDRPEGCQSWHPARSLRDGVAVEVVRIEDGRRAGRRTYTLHCRRLDGLGEIVSTAFYGANAIPTAVLVDATGRPWTGGSPA